MPRGAEWEGGFDAVIGNPPYIRIQAMKEWAPVEVEFYRNRYEAAKSGNYDIYVVFIERCVSILKSSGRLGFIVPNKFLNAEYGAAIRGILSKGAYLRELVHFGAQQVFATATTYTCLLFLGHSKSGTFRYLSVSDIPAWIKTRAGEFADINAKTLSEKTWNFAAGKGADLIARLKSMGTKLGQIADIFVGLQTSADDVFILDFVSESKQGLRLRSKVLETELTMEKELFHPLVSGTDVQGYAQLPSRQFILFPYRVYEERSELIPFEELSKLFPRAGDYLARNRKRLEGREKGKFNDANWHRFGRNQNVGIQGRVKICVPRLVYRLCAAFDAGGQHFLDNVDVGGVTLKPSHASMDLRVLLALLNSQLLAWFFPNISAPFRGNWMSANRQFLSELPIQFGTASGESKSAHQNQMIPFVDQALELHKRLAGTKTPQEKTAIERQISATDAQINKLVYDLYGLTEEEIKIVEGK
jgi:hypothetical protein